MLLLGRDMRQWLADTQHDKLTTKKKEMLKEAAT